MTFNKTINYDQIIIEPTDNLSNDNDQISLINSKSIRDIIFLKHLNRDSNPYIAKLIEVDYENIIIQKEDCSLVEIIKNHSLEINEIQRIVFQLLIAFDYIHKNDIIHLDVSPSNILYTKGQIRICDFGISSLNCYPTIVNLPYSLWYRPLEIYGKLATEKSDIWALGCVIWELWKRTAIFSNSATKTTSSVIQKMVRVLGYPSTQVVRKLQIEEFINIMCNKHKNEKGKLNSRFNRWSRSRHISSGGNNSDKHNQIYSKLYDLIMLMLDYDMNKRPSASQLLQHEFFDDLTKPIPYSKVRWINNNYYQLIHQFDIRSDIPAIITIIARNIMDKLIASKEYKFDTDPFYQWISIYIASCLTPFYKLHIYEDCPEIIDCKKYDFGTALHHILSVIDYSIF